MKIKTRRIVASCLLGFCVSISASADNVAVMAKVKILKTAGEQISGIVTINVMNRSGELIRNVDLRLAKPGVITIEKAVVQLGQVSNEEFKITTKTFYAQQENLRSGAPINWRLDYDDVDGNHHQTIISSNLIQ